MDRFKAMTTFVEIVNAGGFAKAAKRLAVSRSLVSKQLQQLEAELGARLFQRTTRQFSLTEVGERYYDLSRKILGEVEGAEAAIAQMQKQPRGTLRIATSDSFGVFRLSQIITDFMAKYPQVKVSLIFNNDFRFKPLDLVDSGLDAAICISPRIEDSSIIVRKIGEAEWIPCAAPDYLEKHGEPKTPQDLLKQNCLLMIKAGGRPWQFNGPAGRISVKASGSFVSTVSAVRMAALSGAGIACLPVYSIEDDLAARRLRRVLSRYSLDTRSVYALYPHRDRLPGKVRVFIDYVAKRLAAPAY